MTSDAQVCKYDSNTIHQILMQPLEVDKTSLITKWTNKV